MTTTTTMMMMTMTMTMMTKKKKDVDARGEEEEDGLDAIDAGTAPLEGAKTALFFLLFFSFKNTKANVSRGSTP